MNSNILKSLILGASLLISSVASAGLISIDFEFDARSLEFNGVTQDAGEIFMSIVVDTDTPNLGTGFGDFDNAYAADVFFTSVNLGLNNTKVISDTFLYFGTSVVGFSDTSNYEFSTIFTSYGSSNLTFGTAFDLSTILVPQGPIVKTGNELRTSRDIVFDNGDRITGGVTLSSLANTVSVNSVNVPEPSTLAIFALGMIGLASRRFKKQS